jgi:hypothetical protein
MSVNTEKLVEAYLAIRAERDKLLQEYETKDAELKSDMSELEHMMLAVCNEIGADSIKTPVGTLMRQIKERYVCNDWDNFYKFVLDHQAPQLLEKRIHQGNFKQFYNELEGLPPGVNVMREYGITVRKPSN